MVLDRTNQLKNFIFTSSSIQYPYQIWTSNGFIDTGFKSCEDVVDKMSANDANCKCEAMFPTQLWSMKKMTWAKKTPEFPPNILMLSGCAIPINRNKVLFIGGHYLQHQNNQKTWNIDVST